MLSGLYFLDLMARRGKDAAELVAELFQKVGPHYYDRIDIEMTPEERTRVRVAPAKGCGRRRSPGCRVTGSDRTDGLRFLLDGGGWALIRLSGTEPLMRIYTEVQQEELVARVLRECREMAGA